MLPKRFARGVLGAALIWAAAGSLIGATIFLARYQPWQGGVSGWERGIQLLGRFLVGGAAWGAACGLAFAVVVGAASRRMRADQLSAGRFVLWGALAGAAFPLTLYGAFVLRTGFYDSIPLFATLTAISTLLGAGFGRVVHWAARRAPRESGDQAALPGAPHSSSVTVPSHSSESAYVRVAKD